MSRRLWPPRSLDNDLRTPQEAHGHAPPDLIRPHPRGVGAALALPARDEGTASRPPTSAVVIDGLGGRLAFARSARLGRDLTMPNRGPTPIDQTASRNSRRVVPLFINSMGRITSGMRLPGKRSFSMAMRASCRPTPTLSTRSVVSGGILNWAWSSS